MIMIKVTCYKEDGEMSLGPVKELVSYSRL